jgi:pimeloyl-ACP methyl ester carboxylesterase
LVVVLLVDRGDGEPDRSRHAARVAPENLRSGGMIDVGGRRLYLDCVGSGSPTVLLEAGSGASSSVWTPVLPELERRTRTCAYDRAGLGESDAMPGTHDAGDEISDLEHLLDRAGIKPPYVLVGHSYGGLLVRLFAHAHRSETGGVVLVDAIGRDWWRRGLAAWPKSLAPKLRRTFATRIQDGVDVRASGALDRHVRTLGDTRLIVITAAQQHELFRKPFTAPPRRLYRMTVRGWRRDQRELAALSSDHAHVMATRSDHFIFDEAPDVVSHAILAVVSAVRAGSSLEPCNRLFAGPHTRCLG